MQIKLGKNHVLSYRKIKQNKVGRPALKIDHNKVFMMNNQGYSLREIAHSLNCSKSSIARILKNG